jgi:hypothetical protein
MSNLDMILDEYAKRGLLDGNAVDRIGAAVHRDAMRHEVLVRAARAVATQGRDENGGRMTMKKLYCVDTHVINPSTKTTVWKTWATSAKKAISNVRWRIAGGRCGISTAYWKAWAVA